MPWRSLLNEEGDWLIKEEDNWEGIITLIHWEKHTKSIHGLLIRDKQPTPGNLSGSSVFLSDDKNFLRDEIRFSIGLLLKQVTFTAAKKD